MVSKPEKTWKVSLVPETLLVLDFAYLIYVFIKKELRFPEKFYVTKHNVILP